MTVTPQGLSPICWIGVEDLPPDVSICLSQQEVYSPLSSRIRNICSQVQFSDCVSALSVKSNFRENCWDCHSKVRQCILGCSSKTCKESAIHHANISTLLGKCKLNTFSVYMQRQMIQNEHGHARSNSEGKEGRQKGFVGAEEE